MNRKNLEILLSRSVKGFASPKINLEQYSTPSRVAANLITRAIELGDIQDKKIIELCAGTGILSIAASVCGATVTAIEIDQDAAKIMEENILINDLIVDVIIANALNYESDEIYDTAIINPPFGIQQKKYRDIDFITKAHTLASIVYSIVDGSPGNIKNLPKILEKHNIQVLESYLDEFPLAQSYSWHKQRQKVNKVLILRTEKIIIP
ncbi:MAG: tRNA1(Val) (adenine(37)-N6)-methyltransferase [Candidatus Heimdallarchaeota archaeon LC_2]|nr:MAG: tRNA1(Val) (adenine(37)-N6)-methyltransferase [Candidatus Heimdallarchaeota archaeon LC_2]